MKTLLLSCILGLAAAVSSNAASINFDTGGGLGHVFTTSTGVRLPIGSIVRMGTLTEAGNAGTFVEFARTTINNTGGASTFTGFLRDGVSIATQGEADAIKGKQIYLYVYNATTQAGVDTTGEKGLFTSTEWTLPSGFDSASTTTFNVKLGAASGGTPPANTSALIGEYGVKAIQINANVNQNGSVYALAGPIIPEASTSALAGFAGLALLGRRKRRA